MLDIVCHKVENSNCLLGTDCVYADIVISEIGASGFILFYLDIESSVYRFSNTRFYFMVTWIWVRIPTDYSTYFLTLGYPPVCILTDDKSKTADFLELGYYRFSLIKTNGRVVTK